MLIKVSAFPIQKTEMAGCFTKVIVMYKEQQTGQPTLTHFPKLLPT